MDDCQLVTDAGRRQLRSSDAATCVLSESPGLLFGTVSLLNSANLIVLDSSAER